MKDDSSALLAFIRSAKENGAADEFLLRLLEQHGWAERKIYQAFTEYYQERTGLPVPLRGAGVEDAKDAFLYLLSFIALGTWTMSLGSLLFSVADRYFQTAGADVAEGRVSVSTELAGIIVAFPLFMVVTWAIVRATAQQPERLESPVRKWLTYAALLIAASILIGDVVTLLAFFLRGDLTGHFAVQVVILFLIAGNVFWYYGGAMRSAAPVGRRDRLFAAGATVMVAVGLVLGFAQLR